MFIGRPCSMLPSWALLHLFPEPSLCSWWLSTMGLFFTEQARFPTTVLETKVGSKDYDCSNGRFSKPLHHQDTMFPSPGLICLSGSDCYSIFPCTLCIRVLLWPTFLVFPWTGYQTWVPMHMDEGRSPSKLIFYCSLFAKCWKNSQ